MHREAAITREEEVGEVLAMATEETVERITTSILLEHPRRYWEQVLERIDVRIFQEKPMLRRVPQLLALCLQLQQVPAGEPPRVRASLRPLSSRHRRLRQPMIGS